MKRPPGKLAALAPVALLGALAAARPAATQGDAGDATPTVGAYLSELERMGLLDVSTGTRDSLRAELSSAESLLQAGNPIEAAVALYAIVESPRYGGFEDFVEYQNAEYDLAVALAASGAYESALDYLARVLSRGPDAPYWAPAHRRAVDVALETRDYADVLARLEAQGLNTPTPPGAAGERAYLRARSLYERGDLAGAEAELTKIGRQSRLYSSALYTRGVIRARQGDYQGATDAMCEVVEQPDDDTFTFVVDNRYFTVKDLARLGLGRVAHEDSRYDDAYYHYFQIPEDSPRLSEALFEAAWSMYQRRELATARDLTQAFLRDFPGSPLTPEAQLLAGYIELADCKFDPARAYYERLVSGLAPVITELERARKDPARRQVLFSRALSRYRAVRTDPDTRPPPPGTPSETVLSYLQLDPEFVRIHEAVTGIRRAAGDAPHVVRAWRALARRAGRQQVAEVSAERTVEQEDADDASALLEDVHRLREEVERARAELARGRRARTLSAEAARDESARLDGLARDIDALALRAQRAAERADAALSSGADPRLGAMMQGDLARARTLAGHASKLTEALEAAADRLAREATERLYQDMRRVRDKAELGRIDAVIGQKRALDIEVADLAAGRYPPELYGRLWEQGLIGDDEELWPFEGELWKDEYEGWR